jgi:hypothetical protein
MFRRKLEISYEAAFPLAIFNKSSSFGQRISAGFDVI